MSNAKKIILTSLAVVHAILCFAQAKNPIGSILMTSDKSIGLRCPLGWQQLKTSNGALLTLISPKESADDSFPETITVRLLPADSIRSLEDLKKFQEQNVLKAGKPQIFSSSLNKQSRIPFVKTEFSLDTASGVMLSNSISFLHHGKVYMLFLTSEKSKNERYKKVLNEVFQSVSLR